MTVSMDKDALNFVLAAKDGHAYIFRYDQDSVNTLVQALLTLGRDPASPISMQNVACIIMDIHACRHRPAATGKDNKAQDGTEA